MPAGGRALAWFWCLLLLMLAGAGAVLQALGPVVHAPAVAVVAPPAPPPSPPAWDGTIAAPSPALLEPSRAFPPANLPRIAADGRRPAQVYARPSQADPRPRIALLFSGIGLSEAESRTVITQLPGAVTLALSPYATNPAPTQEAARAAGHEMLASLPMEQASSQDNPGAHALLTGATPAVNRNNLEWVLGRTEGYAGVTGAADNGMRGERFAAQTTSFIMVMEEIARRGLFYIDTRPPPRSPLPIPTRAVDIVLDEQPTRANLEAQLAALERRARESGSALGLAGPPRPVVIERLAAWTREVEARGFVLVPVSALVQEIAHE